MITLKTTTSKTETTVTATDAKGNYITSETWDGVTTRVKVALAHHVRNMADNLKRRANTAAILTTREGQELARRAA